MLYWLLIIWFCQIRDCYYGLSFSFYRDFWCFSFGVIRLVSITFSFCFAVGGFLMLYIIGAVFSRSLLILVSVLPVVFVFRFFSLRGYFLNC